MIDSDPLSPLREAVAACVEAGAAHAVIGAVARNAWATPRATTDIDLAIVVDRGSYQRLLEALARRGFRVKRTMSADSADLVPDLVLLELKGGVVERVDLLVAKTPFELEAVASAVETDIGTPCRVVTPEHLIIYKLIAGRPHDLLDAEEVARTRSAAGSPVDFGLIEHWVDVWDVKDRLVTLRRALTTAPGAA